MTVKDDVSSSVTTLGVLADVTWREQGFLGASTGDVVVWVLCLSLHCAVLLYASTLRRVCIK